MPSSPRPSRPASWIQSDLDTALAYRQRYQDRPAADRWTQMMRDDNERDIQRLTAELADAQQSAADGHGDKGGDADAV